MFFRRFSKCKILTEGLLRIDDLQKVFYIQKTYERSSTSRKLIERLQCLEGPVDPTSRTPVEGLLRHKVYVRRPLLSLLRLEDVYKVFRPTYSAAYRRPVMGLQRLEDLSKSFLVQKFCRIFSSSKIPEQGLLLLEEGLLHLENL